jgi:hypothetical protein
MKKMIKKAIVYSLLIGITQFGVTVPVIEASQLYNEGSQGIVQLDNRHSERNRRERQENIRHQREMQRRHNENDREWNDRQWRENQRHDNTMNEIFAGIIGIVIGSQL